MNISKQHQPKRNFNWALFLGLLAIAFGIFFGPFVGFYMPMRSFLEQDIKAYFEDIPTRVDLFAALELWLQRQKEPNKDITVDDLFKAYKKAREFTNALRIHGLPEGIIKD